MDALSHRFTHTRQKIAFNEVFNPNQLQKVLPERILEATNIDIISDQLAQQLNVMEWQSLEIGLDPLVSEQQWRIRATK